MNNQDKIDFRSHLEFELCTFDIFCKTIFFWVLQSSFMGQKELCGKSHAMETSCVSNPLPAAIARKMFLLETA